MDFPRENVPTGPPDAVAYEPQPSYSDAGRKDRDHWWTVLAVDPIAIPLTRLLIKRRWSNPDEITLVALILGVLTGLFFAVGDRWALVTGGVVYYLSVLLDSVDGKLARALNMPSAKGGVVDAMADNAGRASASIGLVTYLVFHAEAVRPHEVLLAAAFGVLAASLMEIRAPLHRDATKLPAQWDKALARFRLLPTPGMPDVCAIVFVLGPVAGLVIPALYVGLAMVGVGILMTWRRELRT